MYGECWFTGKFYFKHGGSQNATLNTMRNRTGVIALILGVALSDRNKETGKLSLPNNSGYTQANMAMIS